ncbi:MAG: hypothetical protein U0931_09105 [Vulcanimicrobiota bacterium]
MTRDCTHELRNDFHGTAAGITFAAAFTTATDGSEYATNYISHD